ncbi:hypothetical protein BHE90_011229 [Fusarium euwallaceae]|uniref:DNA2/NAM7 helicase helicase domain-containing protein n=1 Tax=Fusarium euwallaceae TaxID=1147111 RepID=A0A430LF39_9HYPO|nr:hypothetical protein BHE90_011229 [Fusarium euwallaceae]
MPSGQSRRHGTGSAPAPVVPTPNLCRPCAILLDGCNGPILGGKALGVQSQSEIDSHLFMYNLTHAESSLGFSIEFPYGQVNEEEGFGLCHRLDYTKNTTSQSDMHKIEVRFPREGFFRSVESAGDALRSRFPGPKHLSLVEVSLRDPTLTKVHGFGMPFKNHGHTSEEWLNQGVMVGNRKYTLLDILRKDKFQIVVVAPRGPLESNWDASKLPPPFAYPYGNIHSWSTGRYAKMLSETKGNQNQFPPTWNYHDDNAHLAALTQFQVQDFLWLNRAVGEIAATKVSAYFVEFAQGNKWRFYVIVVLSKAFKRHKDALCHLTKEVFKLDLYDNWEDRTKSGEWDAKVVDHPQGIDALNAHHPIAEHEMVLLVRRPLPTQAAVRGSEFEVITFHNRLAANVALNEGDYKRKVDAVCLFQPGEQQPTNSIGDMSRDEVDFRMSLHRDLVRGTGFYDTMLAAGFEGPSLKPLRNTARSLPVVNLLGTDEARVNALVEEGAHPDDRVRFQTYLSERPLGLGVITADAWTLGESNALAVGSIGMACSLGKIYITGPTDAVVDSFAARLDRVGTSVTDRVNEGKKNGETRVRYRHVVRGYKIDDEVSAFLHLLRFPDDDRAAPSWFLSGQSDWKMPLSAAYWLLILLRSPKVRPLRLDDSAALHEMRSRIEKDRDEQLYRLGALAAQGIDWIEYEQGAMLSKDRLVLLLEDAVSAADIVCTTPSLSAKEPYSAWKHKAQGIVVDEAACMSRPDLYCVWGNTLLPCLMAGDDKEFPPKALDRHNRFGQHARISPLLWFKAMGWPVYRLSCQGRSQASQEGKS